MFLLTKHCTASRTKMQLPNYTNFAKLFLHYNNLMQIFGGKRFENPIEIIEAFDNKSFKEAFSQIEILRKRPDTYLLGYIRYEAKDIFLGKKIISKYPLLYFEVFDKSCCYCKEKRSFDTMHQNSNDKLLRHYNPLNDSITPIISFKTYKKAIHKIKEEIANGNTYEVNYTYDYKIETNMESLELYQAILPRQITPYNAYIKNNYEEILSFSPELFFELKNNKIKTKPMKGTVKRGQTEEEDKNNIKFLKNDIKNRAENVMIVDLLRNDLGKIAKTGTVKVDKLFEVETHKTVHQMTSEISAELEDSITLYEIFDAIFPCGSITGAPKISTMEIIENTEINKREVYCGAIGLISPEKTVFSVPIRTLQKHNDEKDFLCRVGGAIVWDSTAEEEWEETQTKIKFLRHCKERSDAAIQEKKNELLHYVHNDVNKFQIVETILFENGELKYKDEHFERMKKSAKELGFEFNEKLLKIKPTKDCILRILLNKNGTFEVQEKVIEKIKTNKIVVSKTKTDNKEPLLYHKTTHRPWYEKSKKVISSGIFDEIFFNENEELTEGSRSNVILQINNNLFTPPIECGILNGVLRQILIKENKIKEKKLYLDDVKKAEKIFCINSVRGIIEGEIIFD